MEGSTGGGIRRVVLAGAWGGMRVGGPRGSILAGAAATEADGGEGGRAVHAEGLERWFDRALAATTLADVFSEPWSGYDLA